MPARQMSHRCNLQLTASLLLALAVGLLPAGCAPKRVYNRSPDASFEEIGSAKSRRSQADLLGRDADEGQPGTGMAAVILAREQVGRPYRYGGAAPSGFDCSGLVQYVYGRQGIELPRTAREQARHGQAVGKGELVPGDLLFFRTRGGAINHVGIYIGDGEFIHAPSRGSSVRRESLADPWWSQRLTGARRVY